MSAELVKWIVPMFFLGALVLVSRLGRQISSISRESYRLITWGITILALVSLGSLYRDLGLFGKLPFLSEAVFFDLITWIFGITGSIFILSGVSHWLPLARKQRQINESAVKKLEILKKVEQLLGVETRLDSILASTVEYMISHFDMAFGAVYKYSARRRQLRFVAGTAKAPSILKRLELSEADLDRLDKFGTGRHVDLVRMFADIPGDLEAPATVLPLMVDNRPEGFFVLWGEEDSVLTSEDDLTLKLAIDTIVQKIGNDRLVSKYQSGVQQRAWKRQLEAIVGSAPTAREAFSPLVQCLGQRLPTEFSALAIIDETGDPMRRLSWGPGGRVLAENGLPVPKKGMLTARAYLAGETVVENNMDAENRATAGEIVTDGNTRSLVAAPIMVGGRIQAVITLASSEMEAYSQWEMEDLKLALPVLERLVADESARREIRRRDRRLTRLSRLVRELPRFDTLNEIFAEAAELVSDEVGADIVRVSTPNTNGAFLKSRTLVRSRPFEQIVPANGELIVSLMPLHEQVLRNGQAMLSGSDRTCTDLVEFERQQAFAAGVRSSMIVPVIEGDRVAAVISIAAMGDSRNLHRDGGALVFAESVAHCLEPAIRRFEISIMDQPAEPVVREITGADRDILAGIADSLERRWSDATGSEDEIIDRYLSVIRRPVPDRGRLEEREAQVPL